MGFEERMWQHVDKEKLDNTDSSTEAMLATIEKRKDDIHMEIADTIIQIKKLEELRDTPDEFGEGQNSAVIHGYKKEIEGLRMKRLSLEEKLRDLFSEEFSIQTGDDLAGNEPEETISLN
jgi:hypothetical protein